MLNIPMRSRFDLRPARRLAHIIRSERFGLVHTHSPRAALVGRVAARLAGVPMVHHAHGRTATEVVPWWQNAVNSLVLRASLTGVDVIAVSPSTADYLSACGVPRSRISVVPNGVPALDLLPERARPKPPWTIGIVALFRPRKGLEVLLEAMSHLQSSGHRVVLRVIGPFESADYELSMRALAGELGLSDAVKWLGFQENMRHELSQLDLLVCPSVLPEGLPMVVIEAMAAGVPVVGTQVEGIVDVIRTGRDGLLVPPNDPAALAQGIADFLTGHVDWQAVRQAAHHTQRTQFSDASMAAGVADVYRRVLARRRSIS